MRRMFSEKQIATIIANAISGGLLSDIDVKAKTLEQNTANWNLPITTFGKFGTLDAEVLFARVQKINQELEIVVSLKYTNNTESSISAYNVSKALDLPDEIAEKIIDFVGNSVKASSTGVYIASSSAWASKRSTPNTAYVTGAPRLILSNESGAGKMAILLASPSSMVLPAGESLYIEGRIQLTLI